MASMLGDLVVRIVGDTADFVRAVDHSGQRLNKFEKDLKKITDTMSKVGKKMTTYVTLPILAIGAAMVKAAADMEMQEAAFTTMLGSAEAAKILLSDLRDLAARTPFQLTDLAASTKTMLAFGIETEKVLPYLKQLGDIAMGDADKLKTLTLAFSQIQSTGRLMGQDLLQLINAGFNPLQIISEKTGETMAELKKRMEKGAISAVEVAEAFKIATSEGGLFFGGMERASQTLTGQFSTLKDDVVTMAIAFGNLLLPAIKNIVGSISGFVKRLNEMDEGQRKLILTMMGIAAVIGPLLLVGAKLITFLGTLKAAFIAVNVVMAANPILAIVTAVALLGTAAYLLVKNWEKVAPFFKKVWNTIIDIFDFAYGPIVGVVIDIINIAKEFLVDKFIKIAEALGKTIDWIAEKFGKETKAHQSITEWIDKWEIPARKRLSFSLRDLKVDTEGASDALTEDFGPALKETKKETDELAESSDNLTESIKQLDIELEEWIANQLEIVYGLPTVSLGFLGLTDMVSNFTDNLKVTNEYIEDTSEKIKAQLKLIDELKEKYKQAGAVIEGYASPMFEAFGRAMIDQANAAEILKQAFKDLIVAILKAIGKELAIRAAKALIPLPGLFNPAGAALAIAASIAAFVAAGVVAALQKGGVTKGTIPAILHPNEAVLPLENEEAMARIADAIANAQSPSVQMGEQLFHVTVNLGSRTLYDDITKATRDRRILIDAGAVA